MQGRRITEPEIRIVLELLLSRQVGIPLAKSNNEPRDCEAETTRLASSMANLTIPEACDRFQKLHPTLTSEWSTVDPRALYDIYGFGESLAVETVLEFVSMHSVDKSENYTAWASNLPEGAKSASIQDSMVTVSAGPQGVSDKDQILPAKMPVFIQFANKERAKDFTVLLNVVFGTEAYLWKVD